MITPTVGRVVWFYPHAAIGTKQPYAALVAYVWSDRLVNLAFFDSNGLPAAATSVPLLQGDDQIPASGFYAAWMPYQKGQAAKTEAVEAKASAIANVLGDVTDYDRYRALENAVDFHKGQDFTAAADEVVQTAEKFHAFLANKAQPGALALGAAARAAGVA